MGCSHSKLEPDELRGVPGRLRPSRFCIRKQNGTGGGKKCIFITAAELMLKEVSKAGDAAGHEKSHENGAKSTKKTAAAPAEEEEEEEEEERNRKRSARVETREEELPGSPSFRFYFHRGAPPPKWMENDAPENKNNDHVAMHHEDNVH